MEYLVVANAKAGGVEQDALGAATDVLARAGPVEVVRTGGPAELGPALARLDQRVLVVAGGDGSLHAVIDHLWRERRLGATTVGLVPLGTGNDFARGAGVPLDPAEAAEAVAAGRPRRLDVMSEGPDSVVVNVAHAGLGAEAAARSAGLKDRLGPLAYPVGALVAGVQATGWRLDVSVDGRPVGPEGQPLLMVAIANGSSIGGGTLIAPGADPGDGVLEVVVVSAVGPAARAAFAAALRNGEHLRRDDVHHARGTDVVVTGEPVRHNVDGEVSGEVSSRRYTLVPGAWSLLVRPSS